MSVDILKIDSPFPSSSSSTPPPQTIWIRVPRQDARAVGTALSSWVGGNNNSDYSVAWRICAKGNFLGALVAGSGADLFISS